MGARSVDWLNGHSACPVLLSLLIKGESKRHKEMSKVELRVVVTGDLQLPHTSQLCPHPAPHLLKLAGLAKSPFIPPFGVGLFSTVIRESRFSTHATKESRTLASEIHRCEACVRCKEARPAGEAQGE